MSAEQSFNTSATSPARISRLQEKQELAHLNDRLLSYIEQVRNMKESNVQLELELQTVKESSGKDLDALKALYEAELADARNLIDETAKEKARQQILANKNLARVEELEAELKELREENDRLEGRAIAAERNATSLEAQRKTAVADKAKFQKRVKDLEQELEELKANLEGVKGQLEAETLSKVDLQNNIQSLREDLAFKKKMYEEELAALREKHAVIQTSGYLEQTDYQSQLDTHLEEAIDELREKSELEIEDYKTSVENAYKDKLENLERQTSRDAATITKLNSDLRQFSSTQKENNSEIAKLQKEIERLDGQLRGKDEELARLRQLHSEEVARLSEELRSLRGSYEAKIREYEELMDIKIQLDQEIATYRALLQEEETRLHLTPTPREKRTRTRTQQVTTSEPASKKPRYDTTTTTAVSTSASGCIHITKVDPNGGYVEIKNMSNDIESLGGFKIIHVIDDEDEVTFRFHNKSKLQGGTSVTVWGSDAEGAIHNPPTDVVWRNQGTWGSGSNVVTKLVNKAGEVVATYTQQSETSPAKGSPEEMSTSYEEGARSFPHIPEDEAEKDAPGKRYSTRSSSKKVGHEHMFHQKGDPRLVEKANCVVS